MAAETTARGTAVSPVPWLGTRFKSAVLCQLPETGLKIRLDQPWKAGKHLRQVDAALPGKHVRRLYDSLTRREAQVLAQLRTGHSRLRGFLAKLNIEESSVRHFLLHCRRYQNLRSEMINEARDRYGDLSYMLGGRSLNRRGDRSLLDGPVAKWTPNLKIVHAVIRYAMATGRLSTGRRNTDEAGGRGS
jgi:hypothetical protein